MKQSRCCCHPKIIKLGGGVKLKKINRLIYHWKSKPYFYVCMNCKKVMKSIVSDPDLDKYVIMCYYGKQFEI